MSEARRILVLRVFAAALVVVGVFPLANVLTSGRSVPWYSAVVGEWALRGALLAALAIAASRFFAARLDRAIALAKSALSRPSALAFGLGAAALALLASAAVSLVAFGGEPFTTDEMAQQWHARILASGHLFAHAEPAREFFNTAPVLDAGGRWFSQYPVGGPALIALGVMTHTPWLVNPVLLGIATLALYRFFAGVSDELRARGATLLFVTSPMVLVMAGSQMNHVGELTFAALALWALSRWAAAEAPRAQLIAAPAIGVAIGAAATVRPLDAALLAALIGVVQLRRCMADSARWRSVAAQVVAGAIPVALLLWANAQTTGRALLFGYEALNGASHGLGFHVDPNGDMHSPIRGLTLVSGYLMKLSLYFFEWPLPGVLVIVAGILAVRRPTRWDLLMAGLFAATLMAYAAYWFDGFFAGPRFLFAAAPAFVYFAARLPDIWGEGAPPVVKRATMLVIPVCIVVAWLGPWGASSASSRIALYREQRTKLKTPVERQIRDAGIHKALVFVTEGWRGVLLTRLRVLGASQFLADRLATTLDACGLQAALDAESLSTDPDSTRLARVVSRAQALGVARPIPNMPGDQAISLVPGTSPTPRCLSEFRRDSVGTMPYPMFLARQSVGADGRVGGDIVFARDLGDRNEELRSRFGDRAWYRYRPTPPSADTARAVVFVPYR